MKRLIFPLILAMSVTACAAQAPAAAPTTPPADVAGPTTPATTAAPVPGFDTPAAFGDTVTFPSGVEVTVKPLSFAPPGEDVRLEGEGNQAMFSLTINNKSGARIDASDMSWPDVSYGEGEFATLISNAGISTMLAGDKQTDKFSRFIPASGAGKVRVEIKDPDGGMGAVFEGALKP